jgi:hypothetical protein
MELEMNTYEHVCVLYKKSCLQVNNYKHGDEMRIFEIISDEFNVNRFGISVGLISY